MNIIDRFKLLPKSSRKLLSFGIIIALVIALPLFVWGVIFNNFNLRERAASGEPSTSNTPINWVSGSISIKADDFYIISNGKRYDGNTGTVTVSPGPSGPTVESIEVASNAYGDNLKLQLMFRKDLNNYSWWAESITFLNSNFSPDTSRHDGVFFRSILGQSYSEPENDRRIIIRNSNGQEIATVYYSNLRIQAFAGQTPPPTACAPVPMTLSIPGISGVTGINQKYRFYMNITHNDPNCLGGVTANLSIRKPDGWIATFENPSFYIAPNQTYNTTLEITPTTFNYVNEPIIVSVNTSYPPNSASTTVQLSVQQSNVPTSTPNANYCSATCNSNYDCLSSLSCIQGICRNASCSSNTSCFCATTNPAPTPSASPNPSPTPLPYQSLNIRVKFAGVNNDDADGAKIRLRFVKPTSGFDYITSPIEMHHISGGVYNATITFGDSLPSLPVGSGYTIYAKGEKHIATKFCKETGQTTRCLPNESITIPAATQNPASYVLDFTGIPLEPGDLPNQDGVANVSDFAKIISLLGKSCSALSGSEIFMADLDYNGCVNVRDAFLMRKTLETRYDD